MSRELLPGTQEILDSCQELKEDELKWLWEDDYYDGPLSGMMEIKATGQKVWAFLIDECDWVEQYGPGPDDCDRMVVRIFALYELTPEQQTIEEYWHELFKLCVGEAHSYTTAGKLISNTQHYTQASFDFFYARRKKDYKELDLTKSKLIGWFE
ncbi:hypothetical protein LCGC14_2541960 [marine sediment metagenome]|uniref:Uncharacterized protein n=1 Tax=marine sediment metagenome TaxID=412755 RepID=A0A0F9AQH8_9ZZZZ